MTLSGTSKSLSGFADDISSALAKGAITGGPAGSAERKDQMEFLSDTLSLTGQKFYKTDQGKAVVRDAVWGLVVPVALVTFAAGWWLGKRGRA